MEPNRRRRPIMRVGFGTLAALLALGSSLALTAVVASADTVVVKYHSAYATAAFQTTVGRNPAFLVIDANDEFVDGVESSWLAVE